MADGMNKNKKIIIGVAVVVALGLGLTLGIMKKTSTGGAESVEQGEVKMFVIETEYGTIEAELYPGDAPKTVARMTELADQGFFDGLTFHRVVPNFVVQGGDPTGTGMGGSSQNIVAEFNSRQHVEGTLAMARASDPNSADSQFYIALGKIPHLDGQYTIWGQVIKGIEAVKQIKVGDKMNKVYTRSN